MPPYCGWGPVIILPVAVLLLTPAETPRWVLMWLLAIAIFFGCKWLTWRRTPVAEVPWWQHAGYLLAWPGMDAKAFFATEPLSSDQRPTAFEWGIAVANILIGVILFWGVSRLVPPDQELLLGWVGMVGTILIFHFGSFKLLSCVWRSRGINAHPLMNNPLASTRVSEFWGKRWNTAFRDLTHRFFFRPVVVKLGLTGATLAGFVFSGLVHEVVISVPARAGYGGPTLFFTIQGIAILFERSRFGKALGLGQNGRGWLFTALVLVLPVFILFHPPFVKEIVVPFMKAFSAIG